MLPFLQPKKLAQVIIAKHTEDGQKVSHEEGSVPPELMAAAEALIRGLSSNDSKAVAHALDKAFKSADAMPHVEGPHVGGGDEG